MVIHLELVQSWEQLIEPLNIPTKENLEVLKN